MRLDPGWPGLALGWPWALGWPVRCGAVRCGAVRCGGRAAELSGRESASDSQSVQSNDNLSPERYGPGPGAVGVHQLTRSNFISKDSQNVFRQIVLMFAVM